MPYRVGNIVRKGEVACYKQFLLFSQCFLQLYIFGVSKYGIVWQWLNIPASALTETSILPTYRHILHTDKCMEGHTDTGTDGQTGKFQYTPENIRFEGV